MWILFEKEKKGLNSLLQKLIQQPKVGAGQTTINEPGRLELVITY